MATNDTGEKVAYTTKSCMVCGKQSQVEVPRKGLEAFNNGALVQDAFPDLSSTDRELLISGTHGDCWESMF